MKSMIKIASIFLDISLGLLCLGAISRLALTLIYTKKNGERTLTPPQLKTLKTLRWTYVIAALIFAVVSLFLFIF